MVNKKEEPMEEEKSYCKCPNCGVSLSIVQGEEDMSDKNIGDLDEKDQRDVMEGDFKKRMGKLEEYN